MVVAVAKYERADVHALLRLRMTAYHMVDASRGALDPVPGQLGCTSGAAIPASTSWRCVAT